VTLRRLKAAEWTALVGAVGLLLTLFLNWYRVGRRAHASGWDTLGWLTLTLLVIAIVAAIALAVDAFNTPPGVVLAAVGLPALAALFVDLLTAPWPSADLAPAGWAGAVFAVALVAGGMASIVDERTTGFGRHYTPPAPRAAPPVH
jgi:hypothetical protein